MTDGCFIGDIQWKFPTRLAAPHLIGNNPHMRNLTAILCLTLAVLLGTTGEGVAVRK